MTGRKIGLVLDGGGGKGAYQIGVWKALSETGLDRRIVQISGASVGALNAALMVQGDYELAEKIWFEEMRSLKPTRIHMWVSDIIERYLNFSVFKTSPIECWIATTCVSPGARHTSCIEPAGDLARIYKYQKAHYFNMRGCTEEQARKLLKEDTLNRNIMLATCALPLLCTSKRIDGLWYRDGGIVDNSPLRPLSEVPQIWDTCPRCDYLLVIHLDPVRYDHDPLRWNGTTLLQITPSSDLGGFFKGTVKFDPANARRLADAGYAESLKLFRKLLDNEKRIEQTEKLQKEQETTYFEQIIKNKEALALCERILRKEHHHE